MPVVSELKDSREWPVDGDIVKALFVHNGKTWAVVERWVTAGTKEMIKVDADFLCKGSDKEAVTMTSYDQAKRVVELEESVASLQIAIKSMAHEFAEIFQDYKGSWATTEPEMILRMLSTVMKLDEDNQ